MSTHTRTLRVLAGCLVLLAAGATGAVADPIKFAVGGQYSYSLGADRGGLSVPPQIVNSNDPSITVADIHRTSVGALGSVADLDLQGFAAVGELKAFVDTLADVRANTSPFAIANATATGFVEVGFFDTLTVHHPTLAPGTPISFEYVAQLHSTLSITGAPDCYPGAPVPNGGFIDLLIMSGTKSVGKTGCGAPMPDTQLVTALISTFVGAEVVIDGRMRVFVGADAITGGELITSARGDAANTADFWLNPLVAGTTFSSASGASYAAPAAAPVPEPATALLLVGGVCGWVRSRRQR